MVWTHTLYVTRSIQPWRVAPFTRSLGVESEPYFFLIWVLLSMPLWAAVIRGSKRRMGHGGLTVHSACTLCTFTDQLAPNPPIQHLPPSHTPLTPTHHSHRASVDHPPLTLSNQVVHEMGTLLTEEVKYLIHLHQKWDLYGEETGRRSTAEW